MSLRHLLDVRLRHLVVFRHVLVPLFVEITELRAMVEHAVRNFALKYVDSYLHVVR